MTYHVVVEYDPDLDFSIHLSSIQTTVVFVKPEKFSEVTPECTDKEIAKMLSCYENGDMDIFLEDLTSFLEYFEYQHPDCYAHKKFETYSELLEFVEEQTFIWELKK